ncbi:MAG: lipopolysaccharide biosynthesis protein [Prolixibacteraceae bacterium]|jgi:teichuronic acid exporter|nr:lipopolysaccharide biosynthesis protein [Prolixibacteraceae bacterium]MBT6766932.1 lipopolysaccharide biosynthesis protein [Prolixibacteraceae bacterium]MBT7000100.1 lipopolysaccharide biosynthesis protein [Prolixibacteraceae bacterium]MBT7395755.1 lipopolysaccharide biosynthesis protein [Prolixibacteraceae bacterium]
MTSLKQKTATGLKWSAFERFSKQGVGFIISIIIARILSPSDYGIIGMISIFTGVSTIFIGAGFGTALIRKQDRTDIDLSTVFYYNIVVSLFFYLILFISAPYIARFYDTPILTPITRVVSINMVIGAFGSIQVTKLNIAIDFKTQSKISIIALVITGTIGIVMAYSGFGVWALVFQQLASTIVSTGLLWYFIGWKPVWVFSINSFKDLFGFGSKLMLSGLLDTIYKNIYQVVIGKMFTSADLGFFTRAKGLAQLPSSNVTNIIQRVTFPVLSEMQNDTKRLGNNYRKLLKMSAFVIFPMMMLLCALGEPLIKILLTDKWLPAVPFMQVLCFSHMLYPIHSLNLNLLQVKGRSDLFLRLEIIKKVLITIVLFVSAPFGVLVMCYGTILTSIFSLIINTYYTGKIIQIGFFSQVKDMLPVMILSFATGFVAYLPAFFVKQSYFQLISGGILGGLFFIGASYLFNFSEFIEVKNFIFKKNK